MTFPPIYHDFYINLGIKDLNRNDNHDNETDVENIDNNFDDIDQKIY